MKPILLFGAPGAADAISDLTKAQVKGYTRSDGTYVKPHTTSRQAATKVSKSSVDVQGADRYEFANGKKPSGKGSWIFSPHKTHDFDEHGATPGEHYFQTPAYTSYTDAKAQAKKWAAEKGHGVIHLQT